MQFSWTRKKWALHPEDDFQQTHKETPEMGKLILTSYEYKGIISLLLIF